jgi:hypothetical protein
VNKYDRQGAILRLVQERQLATQSELVAALRAGIDAVQTTVPRHSPARPFKTRERRTLVRCPVQRI